MGYACPVCGHPQSDASHLANHLAFTALARGGDHEAWLDDRVPEWESLDESTLGERVVDHADPVEFPQVFEDTTSDRPEGHDHAHGDHGGDPRDRGQAPGETDARPDAVPSWATEGAFEDDATDVLREAREMTRRRRENAADAAGGDADEDAADESETE